MRNNIEGVAAFHSLETSSWWQPNALRLPEHTNHFMQNLLLAIAMLFTFSYTLSAQVCDFQEIQNGWTCETSVVLCSSEIDGYIGILPDIGQGDQPVPFCVGGGSIENALWFSFVALDSNVEIVITPSNCTEGTSMFIGMQAAIYTECEANATIACEVTGTEDPITLTDAGFIPGNTYYLLLDGYGGSVCEFTIDAVSGVADASITLETEGSNEITVNPAVPTCVKEDQIFSFEVPDCEVMGNSQFDFLFEDGWTCYEWDITPSTYQFLGASNSPYVDIIFEEEAVYTINVIRHLHPFLLECGIGQCLDPPSIEVTINFVDTIETTTLLCAGDLIDICGTPIGAPGVYECLDDITCTLTIHTIEMSTPEVVNLGNIFLCSDACYTLDGVDYCERIDYLVEDSADCSTTYAFTLKNVSFSATPDPYPMLDCSGMGVVVSHNVTSNYNGQILLKYLDEDGVEISNVNFATIVEPGDYYFIVYGDGFESSCADTTSFTITINNVSPEFTLTSEVLTCTDQNALISSSTTETIDSYQWSGPSITGSTTGTSINATEEGLYTLVVTGPNGCTGSQSISVGTDYEVIDVDIDWKNLDCNTAQTTLSYLSSLAIDSVLWAGPNEFSETKETPNAVDTGIYALILYAENGCDYTEIFKILGEYKAPEFTTEIPEEWACQTDALDIKIDYAGGQSFTQQWSTDQGIILSNNVNQKVLSVGSTGAYYVEVTDNITGCSYIDTILVMPNDEIPTNVEIEAVSPLCFSVDDGIIEIKNVEGGTGPFTYELDGILQASNIITDLAPASYEVSAIDVKGCEIKRMITIDQPSELLAEITGPTEAVYGEYVTIESIVDHDVFNIDEINWYDVDGIYLGSGDDINVLVQGTTNITMEVIDEKGCITTRALTILLDEDYDYFVPNLFTPNEDGINDYFGIGTQDLPGKISEFNVYDRWGNKVFEAKDIDNGRADMSWGWDGRYNGSTVNSGVYVYYAVVETLGIEKRLTGSVTVVR